MRGRYGGLQVCGVNESLACPDARLRTGDERGEGFLTVEPALREIAHAPARQKVVAHHGLEVLLDFRAARKFPEAGVEATRVDAIAAELRGGDAVEGRGLMQGHERVGVVPVASRGAVSVDHHDVVFAFIDERIGEGHADTARADDQVVGLDLFHGGGPAHRRAGERTPGTRLLRVGTRMDH